MDLDVLKKMAQQGDAEAEFNLGWVYAYGEGVVRDMEEAGKWIRKAAEQGNAKAQGALGAMLAAGQGMAKDSTAAVYWLRKAAEQGVPQAQYNLAIAYAKGDGVAKDNAESVKWIQKAAEHGQANALNILNSSQQLAGHVLKDLKAETTSRCAVKESGCLIAVIFMILPVFLAIFH